MEVWKNWGESCGKKVYISSYRTRILASNFESFIPNETVNSEFRNHMEFDKNTFALSIGESVGIYAKSLHHTE
jgi:hypothetical protein